MSEAETTLNGGERDQALVSRTVIAFAEAWAEKFERIAKACAPGAGDGVAFQMCADYLRANADVLREESYPEPPVMRLSTADTVPTGGPDER